MACVAPNYGDPFVTGLLDYIDCQTQMIASGGFQALAGPSSIGAPLVAGFLTLFVALLGLRMLSGQTPAIGDLIVATLKVGVVLTLATSWIAFRTVVYDPVLKAPAELTRAIGLPAGLPGADGGLVARLQGADDAIVHLTDLGAGRLDRAPPSRTGEPPATPTSRAPLADDLAFSLARIAFLAGTTGALGIVRLASGVLLALAPVFAGLLLFEATRSVFFGWLRALIATSLGALLVTVVLAVELGLLEPWLASAIAQREAFYATPAAPVELLALTLSFAIIVIVATGLAFRLALTSSSPTWSRWLVDRVSEPRRGYRVGGEPQNMRVVPASQSGGRVEQLVSSMEQISAQQGARVSMQGLQSARLPVPTGTNEQSVAANSSVPLGQTYQSAGSRVVAPRRTSVK